MSLVVCNLLAGNSILRAATAAQTTLSRARISGLLPLISLCVDVLAGVAALRRGRSRHIDGAVLAVRNTLAALGTESQATSDAAQIAVSLEIVLVPSSGVLVIAAVVLLLPRLTTGGVRVGVGGLGPCRRRGSGVVQAVSSAGLALSSTGVEAWSLPAGRSKRVAALTVEERRAHHLELDAGRNTCVVHGVALRIVTVGHAAARGLGFAVGVDDGVVVFVLLADLRKMVSLVVEGGLEAVLQ